jgi:hypothetical protein
MAIRRPSKRPRNPEIGVMYAPSQSQLDSITTITLPQAGFRAEAERKAAEDVTKTIAALPITLPPNTAAVPNAGQAMRNYLDDTGPSRIDWARF